MGRITCPVCREKIVSTARKCRFCGEWLSPEYEFQHLDTSATHLSSGDWIVAIVCFWLACAAGVVWMLQDKPKGVKMLFVSIASMMVWGLIAQLIDHFSR